MAKNKASKSQPTSSQVHVPATGEEDKILRKGKGHNPNSEIDADGENTRLVGKVAIIRHGKLLIGTRDDNGKYDFPGGRAKFGEDVRSAAIREVHEETGIELDPNGMEQIGHESKEKNDKGKVVVVYAYIADLDACPPLSESSETDGEMGTLKWFDMSKGLPPEVIDHMHTALEDNVVLQALGASEDGVQKDVDADGDPDMYPGINNLEGGALKSADDEPNGLSDLRDAGEMVSGIDWEVEQGKVDPLTARELAEANLSQDPMYYRKKRLEQDWTSDPLYKDTEEGEQSQFSGEGYNEDALQNGLWVDLGSHNCRESGHIGLDLYPYDYGTAVHDLDTGIPLPDASASKVRLTNVVGDENLSDPKALLSQIHRVLMPGGQFVYEGPEDIYNYPNWTQDYPGLVLTDHEDNCDDVNKVEGNNIFRQKFTRVATPDPATANDAEPRIGIAQYDMLPADALLAMDATGYYWSDSTSSGRGNRLMGYPSQGAMLNKDVRGKARKSISKSVPILKAQNMKQVVYCVVLEPDTADSQDDVMSADDIEETAHNYLIKARLVGSNHSSKIDAAPVESFIAPQDLEYEGQNGPQKVTKGSWVIGIKVFDPEEWQKVLNGEYAGVSVGGKGVRDEM